MNVHTRPVLLALLGLAALVIYLDWTGDRRSGPLLSDLRTRPIESQGQPSSAGNLLGLEVRLQPADYQSHERLRLKFATYLDQARNAGLLGPQTIVVLPEHVGTGLFALGEKAEVQQARTLRDAMQWMALSNPWSYLRALFNNQGEDRRTAAVLQIKARRMAENYQLIFSELARAYSVTLVAGSIVLPEPYLHEGRLKTGSGPLRQISLAFSPEGSVLESLYYKTALSRYERRYSEAPESVTDTLIQTPAGRLAIRLGCDAYERPPPPEAELLVIAGAVNDPVTECRARIQNWHTPYMAVQTLGVPWNLLGSPRKPALHVHTEPVQIRNLWLEERP